MPGQRPTRKKPALYALSCLAVGLTLSRAYAQTPAPGSPAAALENSLIRALGTDPIYLVRSGEKYHIQSLNWTYRNGYNIRALHELTSLQVDAIPTGYEVTDEMGVPGTDGALNGRLVAAGQRVYIVENGQRHWILNWDWITHSRYAGQTVLRVSEAELDRIPVGVNYAYTQPGTVMRRVSAVSVLFLCVFAFLFISTRDSTAAAFKTRLSGLASSKVFGNWKPWHTRAVLFLGFAVAIAAREPYLLEHPRFWAEEGSDWFQHAVTHTVTQDLLYVFPASSYYILTANVGAILAAGTAARLGLGYAPAATTFFAFAIMLLPIALIIFGRSVLFDSLWKKVAGCLIVIFASTTSDELWLNTINSVSFMGLLCFVLLFEKTWTWQPRLRWISRGLLLVCGLSSPYAAAFLPFYILLTIRDRTREQKIQCLILGACVLLQVGSVARVRMHASPAMVAQSHRGTEVHLDTSLVNVFFGQMALSALGESGRDFLADKLGMVSAWTTAYTFPPRPPNSSLRVAAWLCFLLMAMALWHLRGVTLFSVPNLLIAAFMTLAAFTCVASLGSVPTGRYAFLPGMVFLLILLECIESASRPYMRSLSTVVLAFALASGIAEYRSHPFQVGPDWSTEVRIWQSDHSHLLRIWPSIWTRGIDYRPSSVR